MKKLKFPFLLLALLLTSLPAVAEALPSARSVIDKAVAAMKKAPAIEAKFTASYGGHSSSGSILISGNKFTLTTPELSSWFDGRTQWAYSAASQEVNVSEPTMQELEQLNPFAVMQSVQRNYSLRRIDSPSGYDRIELTPAQDMRAPYSKVVLTIDRATSFPSQIEVTASDGARSVIKVQSIRSVKAPAASAFSFPKSKYPGVEIIDLR